METVKQLLLRSAGAHASKYKDSCILLLQACRQAYERIGIIEVLSFKFELESSILRIADPTVFTYDAPLIILYDEKYITLDTQTRHTSPAFVTDYNKNCHAWWQKRFRREIITLR